MVSALRGQVSGREAESTYNHTIEVLISAFEDAVKHVWWRNFRQLWFPTSRPERLRGRVRKKCSGRIDAVFVEGNLIHGASFSLLRM